MKTSLSCILLAFLIPLYFLCQPAHPWRPSAFILPSSRFLKAPFAFTLPGSRPLETRLPCFWQVDCLVWTQLWGGCDCVLDLRFCAVQHDDIAACTACDLCMLTEGWRELLLLIRHQDKLSLQSAFHVTVCLPAGPALIRSQAPDPHGKVLNVSTLGHIKYLHSFLSFLPKWTLWVATMLALSAMTARLIGWSWMKQATNYSSGTRRWGWGGRIWGSVARWHAWGEICPNGGGDMRNTSKILLIFWPLLWGA